MLVLVLAACTSCKDNDINNLPVIQCWPPESYTSGQSAWIECGEVNGDADTAALSIVVSGRARDGAEFEELYDNQELDAFSRHVEVEITESVALIQPGETIQIVASAGEVTSGTMKVPVLPAEPAGLMMVGLDRENVLQPSQFGDGRNLRFEMALVPTHRSAGIEAFYARGGGTEVIIWLGGDGESLFVEATDDWGESFSAELDTNGWGRMVRVGLDLSGTVDVYIDGFVAASSDQGMSFQGLQGTRPEIAAQANTAIPYFWAEWNNSGPEFGDLNPCTVGNDWHAQNTGWCVAGLEFVENDVVDALDDDYLLDTHGNASLLEGAWRFEKYEAP